MSPRSLNERRCMRCCKRRDMWVEVDGGIACCRCATLDEVGAALGVVATVSIEPDGS